MRTKHFLLVAFALALVGGLAFLAIPDTHAALALLGSADVWTSAPHFLVAVAPLALSDITSKEIRAMQAKTARMHDRINELLDLESSSPGNTSYATERIRLSNEHEALCDQIYAAQRRIQREELDPEAQAGAIILHPDGRESRPVRRGRARGATGRSYAAMFGAAEGTDFRSIGELVNALNIGLTDSRLVPVAAVTGGSEGIGQDGGFVVPAQFVATLMDASLENEIVRPRARVEPMTFATKTVAGLDTQDHSSDIGGLTGKWIGELGSLTGQKPRLRALQLVAKKLGILMPMSNEWVEDAADADNETSRALTKAIGWWLDYAFLNGTGAGEPLGILNDPALIAVAKEGGQAAATITYENIKAMYARLHPASVPNAVWIANQGTRAQMLGLVQYVKNAAGTDFVGGSGVPIVKQSPSGEMSLLGLPLLFTEKLPALGTQGDIVLSDLTQYIVGLRREVTIAKSQHLYFDSDATAYRILLRADGRGAWSKAMTPKNGSTLSWAVTLQAR